MIETLQKCKQIDRGDFIEFWHDNNLLLCEFKDGWQMWFNEKAELHREDAAAVVKPDGTQFWYRNGKIHRELGPAVIRISGEVEFWIEGNRIK